MRILIWMAPPF